MLTIKLKIKECLQAEIIDQYCSDYTGLFYTLYNHFDLIDDDYIKSLLNNSVLDKSMFDCCISDVKTKLKQHEATKEKKSKKIIDIQKCLDNNEFKTKKEKRKKYNLINNLARIKRNINNNITFGGKALQREITKLHLNIYKTELQLTKIDIKSTDYKKFLEYKKELIERLGLKKLEFTSKRKLGIYLIGRACEKGNRKIDFDLINNKITFKPSRDFKIDITFKTNGKKQKNKLIKIQEMSNLNLMPVTIRLSNEYIHLSYDEELLNGYEFNQLDCKKEQLLALSKESKKEIYIKHKNEQNDRKKVGKLSNRYMAVDLNPKFIGLSIFDDINDEQKLIHVQCFILSELSTKLSLSSSDKKQVKQNDKRKHEIKEVWKQIFMMCKHFRVYNFVMEDLDFKDKQSKDTVGKELNKQTKNLWHRTLTTNLITKYCNENGLNKIEVNAAYSSFIGNMIHTFFDPISSSIEIGSRGMNKFKKGSSIYPCMNLINQEKLFYLLGENINTTQDNWIQLYRKTNQLKYRNMLLKDDVLIDYHLGNCKSKVRIVTQQI